LAYKLGVAFIDHNHDRKHPLSGFVGTVNFAWEVYSTVCSPVWKYVNIPEGYNAIRRGVFFDEKRSCLLAKSQ
jgi:nitrogenase molybdenum-iron protein alpha/beta subunit